MLEISSSLWIVEILLGLVAIYCSNWALKKVVHRYRADAAETQRWRVNLDQIIFAPMRLVLWVLGIAYVLSVLSFHFGIFESISFFNHVRNAGIIFALAWMALRWKKVMQEHLLTVHHGRYDPATLQFVFKLVTAVVVVLATLVMLQIFGVNVLPLLAFGGIGAAAVGFAAKDVIANFFGGLMVIINRPFIEGDEIYLCQEGIEGYVEKIGCYMTTIRDKNKCLVYLPNALFAKAYVVNRSRRSHRCIEETLDIGYEDAGRVPMLTEELRKVLSNHPKIDAAQSILIGVDELGDYALQVKMKFYTNAVSDSAYTHIRQEVLLKVNALLEEHGVDMPLPTQAISLTSRNAPAPVLQEERAGFTRL